MNISLRKLPAIAVLLFMAVIGIALIKAQPAQAVTAADWRADRIIDDSMLFNGGAMTLADVQYFLNIKVPSCDTWGTKPRGSITRAQWGTQNGAPPPYTCLKDYRQDVQYKAPESGLCTGFGAGNYSAAEIIYYVGQNCGVSQKALIVLLQKEQSLIDDDWPWPIQYRSATGYGCPDTAACDAQYYGFFNQVYNAARQFKRYVRDPQLFNYAVGRNSFIAYQANAPSCGGTNVTPLSGATAALYNFTPYQPNGAALNNMYGTGDACSAYGNRNFWRMYNDWFGTTYGDEIGPYAYRMYHPRGDHNYTARENQRAGIKGLGFRDDGIAFKVSQTQEAGMVPIYRLYNGRLSDYWMIPDGPNRYWAIVVGGYRDEGVAFYAYPANSGTSGSICSQGQAVYQMWHGGIGDHFYTTSDGDRFWALIHGGYVDDKSGNYNNPNQGSASYCIPY